MLSMLTSVTPAVLEGVEAMKRQRGTDELFLLFPLGSQFDHLIKLQLDMLGVFCLVADPCLITAADVAQLEPIGIILSGGPASIHQDPPPFDTKIFDLGIPTLGICLGFQLWANYIGAQVIAAPQREFGVHIMTIADTASLLWKGMPIQSMVMQSHGDRIEPLDKLHVLGSTEHAPVTAANYLNLWGVQFHPEVTETMYGEAIFSNFCHGICEATNQCKKHNVADHKIQELREQIGFDKVLLALSGGSDSSVVAYLLGIAVNQRPGQIRGVYIEGIDRPDDKEHVIKYFGNLPWLDLQIIDATDDFLTAVAGATSSHDKRIAMRAVYKDILSQAAEDFGAAYIAQGTLYTDLSESGGGYNSGAEKAQIKLHHNTNLGFQLPELAPLIDCVKDTARALGRNIGVPQALLVRHPFPGPGLLVRISGQVTRDKLAMARRLDYIFIEELRNWNLYGSVWQAGINVTDTLHTCTKGDGAENGPIVIYWAVWSTNGFTAQSAELPNTFHHAIVRRIGNEVPGVGAVCYRVSNKPFSTIEFG